jgi:predicted DNA-binding antitoxin AbrB/MazE fold protein
MFQARRPGARASHKAGEGIAWRLRPHRPVFFQLATEPQRTQRKQNAGALSVELRLWGYTFGYNCLNNCSILVEAGVMTITVEATYENGVLKPTQPLPLTEHEKVRVTIECERTWAERTAGILQWTGDPAVLRRMIEDPDCGIMESP